MSDKGWPRKFHDPIPLPGGGELITLRDAANYVTKLPKAKHNTPVWQASIEALILVAEHGGDTMLPRIGMMRALYPNGLGPTQRKKPARKYGEFP
jgi:hypothetical protein